VNPYRDEQAAARPAHIAVLDRATWSPLGRIELPAAHVYDVILVPGTMAWGAARGFSSNARREREQAQLSMFRDIGTRPDSLWAVGDPLAPGDCRVAITPIAGKALKASEGSLLTMTFLVRNLGAAILTYAPPNPVRLVYEWRTAEGVPIEGAAGAVTLTRSLPPRQEVEMTVRVRVPASAGEYRLRATLAQDAVGSFVDIDPANAAEIAVDAVAGAENPIHGL
jgi:acetolactate synthase-1/2/3 large subunit